MGNVKALLERVVGYGDVGWLDCRWWQLCNALSLSLDCKATATLAPARSGCRASCAQNVASKSGDLNGKLTCRNTGLDRTGRRGSAPGNDLAVRARRSCPHRNQSPCSRIRRWGCRGTWWHLRANPEVHLTSPKPSKLAPHQLTAVSPLSPAISPKASVCRVCPIKLTICCRVSATSGGSFRI